MFKNPVSDPNPDGARVLPATTSGTVKSVSTYTDSVFVRAKVAAGPHVLALCKRWLPEGKRMGNEWVSRNPMRDDRNPGSFKVNLSTGLWADFATNDRGDIIGLASYLFRLHPRDAAKQILVIFPKEFTNV